MDVLNGLKTFGMFVADGAREKALERERQRFLADEWPKTRERIELFGLDLNTLLDKHT